MKARIVETILPNGSRMYTIQQKHWLLRWLWVDASMNSMTPQCTKDTYYSLESAKKNLCWFDGTKTKKRPL